ncbi:MAG TPA: 2Fe-2S iron-sulfur cluster binding domain-containing protein [Polyangiaceae bacterium]|nr:2Fe-2S iron-sulfur cluster binding domain-containing protein [Polyangiaceae bacterium]
MHRIELRTVDRQSLNFECAPEENLVAAAARAHITLPGVCREGHCGACRGTCDAGEYELLACDAGALSERDRGRGGILLCRTRPRTALSVSVPLESTQLTAGPPPEFECEVERVEDLGAGVRRLELRSLPDEAGNLNCMFEPGQYLELEVPGTDRRRAYSIANAPNWEGRFEFMVRLQPNGCFSEWLVQRARTGDRLRARGPQGQFALREAGLAVRHFVAGGTGVAPFFSMLRQMAEFGQTFPVRLYLGVTRERDLFGQSLLLELQGLLPNLSVEVCVWQPEATWKGHRGSAAQALSRELARDGAARDSSEIYVCGPPGLVEAVRSVCDELKVGIDRVHCERFLKS